MYGVKEYRHPFRVMVTWAGRDTVVWGDYRTGARIPHDAAMMTRDEMNKSGHFVTVFQWA